jgi:hypothetical protein
MSKRLSLAEQADAFRIRMLIGPVKGRDDQLIEEFAEMIERGYLSFDPETQILSLLDSHDSSAPKLPFLRILENGSFQRTFSQ